jgi:hypothetical protein
MVLNPLRLWRRRRRLQRDALEEAQLLLRRYGAEALSVAEAKLQRSDLTRWGRAVIREAARHLRQTR